MGDEIRFGSSDVNKLARDWVDKQSARLCGMFLQSYLTGSQGQKRL